MWLAPCVLCPILTWESMLCVLLIQIVLEMWRQRDRALGPRGSHMFCTAVSDNIMWMLNSHKAITASLHLSKQAAISNYLICLSCHERNDCLSPTAECFCCLATNINQTKVCLSGLIWLVETWHPCFPASLVLFFRAATSPFFPHHHPPLWCQHKAAWSTLIGPGN